MIGIAPRPELLALIAAIKAEPEDDTPKLVLADWLQEQDYPADRARGEYLRVVLACDRLALGDRGRPAALARLHELWRNYPAWLGPLPAAGFRFWANSNRWGLLSPGIDGAHLASKKVMTVAGSEEFAWVAGVSINRVSAGQNRRFIHSPLIESLIALRYDRCLVEPSPVVDLARSPGVCGLKYLDLIRLPIGAEGCAALAGSAGSPSQLATLRELSLSGCDVGDTGFAALCNSPRLNELRSLAVSNAELSIHAARAFADGSGLPALTELNLGGANHIGPDGTLLLVHKPEAGRLRKLYLGGNGVADYGVEAICRSDHMSHLTYLDLNSNLLTNRAALAIAGAEHLRSVEELNLKKNAIDDGGIAALANSPYLDNLSRLDLAGNPISVRAAAILRERFGERVVLG